MKNKGKQEFGVTLISLVVTIIVLIILAGISIGVMNSNSGIIGNSSKAKFKTEVKDIEEKIELTEVEKNGGEDFKYGTLKEFIGREDEYNEILFIENGNLVYEREKVSEEQAKWLEEMHIYEKRGIIPIYTKEQFTKIASGEEISITELGGRKFVFNSDSHYAIQNDINLNGSETEPWQKIDVFNGILDGQNHKVSGLYINTTEHYQGMFGTNNGTIKNLQIIDCNVSGGFRTGAICSINKGEISEIKIYGIIQSTNTQAGGSNLGGICGVNWGGTIEKCENKGDVIKSNNSGVGGIAGSNSGVIKACKNTGNVATNTSYTYNEGGICAINSGSIQSCYNLGNLGTSGLEERYIGGIVGVNQENGSIDNCYSISEMKGGYLGGIVSTNNGNINNCWYIKKGNYELQISSSTGTAENSGEKTEEEMKSKTFLDLLNQSQSEQIWKQSSNKNNGYPYLYWE